MTRVLLFVTQILTHLEGKRSLSHLRQIPDRVFDLVNHRVCQIDVVLLALKQGYKLKLRRLRDSLHDFSLNEGVMDLF